MSVLRLGMMRAPEVEIRSPRHGRRGDFREHSAEWIWEPMSTISARSSGRFGQPARLPPARRGCVRRAPLQRCLAARL